MSALTEKLSRLSAAEEFFEFFAVPYEPAVVHVNRLHILKRFNQYLRQAANATAGDETTQFNAHRALLERAYGDFVRSTPAQEKVFKVFQDAEGGHVKLDDLRLSLQQRRAGG